MDIKPLFFGEGALTPVPIQITVVDRRARAVSILCAGSAWSFNGLYGRSSDKDSPIVASDFVFPFGLVAVLKCFNGFQSAQKLRHKLS